MKVVFLGAGPGDPELITVKGNRILRSARICIYAGSLLSPDVVGLLPDDAEKHNSATMSLDNMNAVFKSAKERDIDVVRLHSGDPSIYGAIQEQMNDLDKLGIGYEIVPGVSSFQASAAALQTELTAPEVSQTIILTRTPGRTPMPEDLGKLAESGGTLCIFLSIHKIGETAELLSKYYGADCPAGVVFRASWPDQKVIRGTLSDIAEKTKSAEITRTGMIVVGKALGRENPVSKLYDSGFSHGYRIGDKV